MDASNCRRRKNHTSLLEEHHTSHASLSSVLVPQLEVEKLVTRHRRLIPKIYTDGSVDTKRESITPINHVTSSKTIDGRSKISGEQS
jgi:hypothetical protein